jgi:hypothetical protein
VSRGNHTKDDRPKLNVDSRQSKLTEKRAKLHHMPSIFRGIHKAVEAGSVYFWRRRGMEPPLPVSNFDPYACRPAKKAKTT